MLIITLSKRTEMDEIEKDLKELKGFANSGEEKYQATKPPELQRVTQTNEDTWKDLWLQKHR